MKSLVLEKYEMIVPEAPTEQLKIACQNRFHGAINMDTVLAQYKYCVQNNLEDNKIYFDYLREIIGEQVNMLGGNHVRQNSR